MLYFVQWFWDVIYNIHSKYTMFAGIILQLKLWYVHVILKKIYGASGNVYKYTQPTK